MASNAGLISLESSKYLEGPSTNTRLVGPDGSVINAYVPGGKILLEGHGGAFLQSGPLVFAQPPIAEFQYPQLIVPESISNVVGVAAPVATKKLGAEGEEREFLHPGTQPRVETREFVPVKEEVEETEQTTSYTTELPVTTDEIQTSTPDVSGAYVPDNYEKHFDDGSYKPEYY
ncbi:hypothetical protein GWI33_019171 [Rhynchophorus ferrugineus]|uniref:Uncharacterized protein n=1 Tax=Rhynchophorus ferrugineus TaxID=354439 RepID=A0A834HUM1_RHYFE|nr:hypothetical protein GWI33_019171 [Rhynchophorus ferrugineus]